MASTDDNGSPSSESSTDDNSSSGSDFVGDFEDNVITGMPEVAAPRRKKRKLDAGTFDEKELSQTEDPESGLSSDEEPTMPSDETDKKYMEMAYNEAKLSPDQDVKVGAVIVQSRNSEVLGKGHNRMPKGCEERLPWSANDKKPLKSKYPYVFHGAKAAIIDALKNKKDLEGSTMYTTLFPANTDAQWIVDLGIQELVYWENTYSHTRFAKAAKKIFEAGGVRLRRMDYP